MLEARCARIPQKSNVSALLSALPEADKTDYVELNMDLIEGRVRYRKGKKWKTRWAVLRRVNPATDVLNLVLYPKDANAGARHKEKALLSLKGFSGLHVLNKMDKHFNVIVIITTDDVIPMSFETIDQRADWLAQLQGHFGKEQSFQGIVPHKQKIKSGEAVLRFYSTFFSLTKKDSYRLIGHWKLTSLPKYGAVEGGFAFQAGPESPTGDKPVIYFFATRSGREIHALFDSVCRAGEAVPGQQTHSEASQPGTSDEDTQAQRSGFFRRAWLRMSGKRPRKGKAARPRSRSMPSTTHGKKKAENTEPTSPPAADQKINQPSVRRNESVPAYIGASGDNQDSLNDVFKEEQPQNPAPGYENIVGVTPEGYEVMVPEPTPSRQGRSSSGTYSPTRKASEGKGTSTTGSEKVDGEEGGDAEGYVVVEGRDEELLEKIRSDSYANERGGGAASQRKSSHSSENGRIKSSSSMSEKREENVIVEEEESEKPARKLSETEKQGLTNGDVQCHIVVTPIDDEKAKSGKETLMNGHEDPGKIREENKAEFTRSRSETNEKAANNADYVNGDLMQQKNNVKAARKHTDNTATSVSTRRGLKNPPRLNLPPTSTAGSAEHLYVNSPKIVDYVNVQGGRPNASRTRSKTGNQPGSKSKLNPYAMYDGNDDSIYHSVESLMPSHPGYQNVLGDDPARCHSFENIAGHSYANVAGAQPSYQNIGHVDRSYVNVMSRPHQGNLNYIRLAGVDSGHAPSPLPITSTSPKSSDYTWIDERKTKLLQDTAKMHSERRQENLPRVMKK